MSKYTDNHIANDTIVSSKLNNEASKVSCDSCSHDHNHSIDSINRKDLIPIIVSTTFFLVGLLLQYTSLGNNVSPSIYPILYGVAYIPVAYSVIKQALNELIFNKDFFNEFSLMSIATLGAFAIGEYPEAVAVMLLYSIGELFQSLAVGKATKNIESLLDVQVEEARVVTQNSVLTKPSEEVKIGDTIQVRVGDRVPVDGTLLSKRASFNTVALTGESVPQTVRRGESILAGMINLDSVIELESTKIYQDSALSKILDLVQEASERKAKTELLIRKFARWYTPIVFGLALLLTFAPALFVSDYLFTDWLYRALVFLVISCPCAIVISIPLSYFGGIGAASRQGILFKGANFLDLMAKVNTVVLDKTGTVTEGVFEVQKVYSTKENEALLLDLIASVESFSAHPIAKAITSFHTPNPSMLEDIVNVEEIAGYGIKCELNSEVVLVGNHKLLDEYNIVYDKEVLEFIGTQVLVSKGKTFLGALLIADKIKEDAAESISTLHNEGVSTLVMLSGDNKEITAEVGSKIGVDQAIGGLLPEDKVTYVEQLMQNKENVVCFVGDGINDAPALALSHVGVAMGAMGADAAIEVADVVIQTDQPSKIGKAISIAKATRSIVFQNIALAFGIKLFVLSLGALGVATMWEAVIADVGVTILVVLNAIRILYKKF